MEHTSHHLPPHLARKARFWPRCERCSARPRFLPELCSSSWPGVSSCTEPGWTDRPQPGQRNCSVPVWHNPSPWMTPPKAQRALHQNWLTYLTHLLNCYYTCRLITSSGNQRGHKFDIELCKPAALQMFGAGGLSGALEKGGTGNTALWKCPPHCCCPMPQQGGEWGAQESVLNPLHHRPGVPALPFLHPPPS